MKWYIDWLGIRGVNFYIPHAFYYSVEGMRSGERPPDVGPNNIWWKHYRLFSDYMKRLSFLMTDSRNGAKVAVLCDNNRVPYLEVAAFYEKQVEFNYLPIDLLRECSVENGRLCIREYCYEAIVDPIGVWKDGGREGISSLMTSVDEVLENDRWRSIVTEQPCPGLRAVSLKKDDLDMVLFFNEGEERISVKWSFTENMMELQSCEMLYVDLWKKEYHRCTGGEELVLGPCETALILLDQGEVSAFAGKKELFLGDWTERFRLVEKKENSAVYETVYETEQADGSEYFVVTGEEMAECYCNDEFAGVSFWNEHRFDIGKYLKSGENVIRLEFTGNAANIFTDFRIEFGLG